MNSPWFNAEKFARRVEATSPTLRFSADAVHHLTSRLLITKKRAMPGRRFIEPPFSKGEAVNSKPRRISFRHHRTHSAAIAHAAAALRHAAACVLLRHFGHHGFACGSEAPTAASRRLKPRRSDNEGASRPTRRFTPAGLTSVSANRLEGSVQGPWTS
jgi:hypothetical protein